MRLVVYSDILDRLLIDFEYIDGKLIVNYIKPEIYNDTNRWIKHGLLELMRDDDGWLTQRVTPSDHPEFLLRLKDYLNKSFNFEAILGERFMVELEKRFNDRDWFHSVGNDQYGRVVVYVKYMCHETLHDIPDSVEGKQVLVHFAASKLATREQFTDNGSSSRRQSSDADLLNRDVNALVSDFGHDKVRDIFYEIHDGPNALTDLSAKHPYARDVLEKLYEEYGFDVLFDLLDHE